MESQENSKRRIPPLPLIIATVVLVALVFIVGRFCTSAITIEVTVNGTPVSLHGAKTMEVAIRESGLPINPGDLISLGGNVLKKSEGYPFDATVNGEQTSDPNYQLRGGENIVVTDGKDKVEEYDAIEDSVPHGGKVLGLGALSTITPGVDGVLEHRTGRLSGEMVDHVTVPPTNAECFRYNPDVGDDKVIALTFYDGPSAKNTATLLDVLKENDVKATFFCTGKNVSENADLVKRERDEGHQVCTGTYDLSWIPILTGESSGEVTAERMREEVEQGQQALREALGSEPSHYASMPVAVLSGDIVGAVDGLIDMSVSWNIDSGDRMAWSADQVFNVLIDLEPGDVVFLHDGSGDYASAIQALRSAIPKLKEAGFKFVTVDQLKDYPAI